MEQKIFKEDESVGMTKKEVEENISLIYEIEQEKNKLADAWDVEIKAEFEKSSFDIKSRIAKTKKEAGSGGIGLEAVRDSLRRLNRGDDLEVAKAIDNEIKKDTFAADSQNITKSELSSALGIWDVTDEMVADWGSLVNGWGKLKSNIEDLFSPYSDSTKKTKLIGYIKNKLDSNANIEAASSDEDKFVAFKKESAAFVIEHLLRHENEKALSDVKSEERKAIIKRMEAIEELDTNTYGDPKKPETVNLFTFLYDEKLKNITKNSQEQKEKTEGSAFVKHMKAHYGWYIGGGALLIIGLIAIFWKSISEWWNGCWLR